MTGEVGRRGGAWWQSEELHSLKERTGTEKANLGKSGKSQEAEEPFALARVAAWGA